MRPLAHSLGQKLVAAVDVGQAPVVSAREMPAVASTHLRYQKVRGTKNAHSSSMPRPLRIYSPDFPYHISSRCNNRERFPGELCFAWKTFTNELYLQTILRKVQIHAFVLMPNHFNLLLTSPECPLSEVMCTFLGSCTKILHARNRMSGRLFGARFYASLGTNPNYFAHALKYVYRNPVKAGLVQNAEDFPFSTLPSLFGETFATLPITRPMNGLDCYLPRADQFEAFRHWLNIPHKKEEALAIQKALRKKEFKLGKDRKTRKAMYLELPGFDEQGKRVESVADPFGTKVLPMSPE